MLKSSTTKVCWQVSVYVGGASKGQGGAQTRGASSQASPPQVEDNDPARQTHKAADLAISSACANRAADLGCTNCASLRAIVGSKDLNFCNVKPGIRRIRYLENSITSSKRALKHACVACGCIKKRFNGTAVALLVLAEVW